MKNVVFILNVELDNGKSTPYHYSIKSWKKWCEKNDVLFFELNNFIVNPKELHINIQKWWALDVLDLNLKEPYDQVCVVDADTIIHPDAPNFFEETKGEFCAVRDNGSLEWVLRSINGWGNTLFPNQPKVKSWSYWNSGFVVYSKKHIKFIKSIQDFFLNNDKKIEESRKIVKASSDQTICNYILESLECPVKLLPECWNLQHIDYYFYKRGMFITLMVFLIGPNLKVDLWNTGWKEPIISYINEKHTSNRGPS